MVPECGQRRASVAHGIVCGDLVMRTGLRGMGNFRLGIELVCV
jgi:hypothetical protein